MNDATCATIDVAAGTYTENVTIGHNVTISGSTSGSTIVDGNNAGSVFHITAGTVSLAKLTIQHGSGTANSFGLFGGGILNYGTLTVTNSTISNNSASYEGGGGGIFDFGRGLTVTNSTLSGNSAAFGGGIYNYEATTTLVNTIVANSSGGDCVSMAVTADSRNNMIGDASYTCGLTNGTNGNIVGQNPQLGPLTNNGGPTQTQALLAGSPAIDAGDDAACAAAPMSNTDQRGAARPTGAHCDIGAYETTPNVKPLW